MKKIDVKAFRKKLIDAEKTIKEWSSVNAIDYDRLKNILWGRVKPSEEEIQKINSFIGG